jgi:hypothetical protein
MFHLLLLLACGSIAGKREDNPQGQGTVDPNNSSDCPDSDPNCGSSPTGQDPDGCEEDELLVEVGTGDLNFESLEDGSPVTMVHGPQGGWHMLGSVQVGQTEPIVRVHYIIETVETGVVIADNTYQVQLVSTGECSGYFPGMYGYLDVTDLAVGEADTPPELLAYDAVRMEMSVEDTQGRLGSATIEVIATPDPADLDMVDTGAP